jgi:hypothetical protein
MNGKARDERLRQLLCEGDPAADDPGLSREQVREMRRNVLSAVPESRRWWGLAPILAGIAAAILALVVGLILRQPDGSLIAPARQPAQAAVVPGTSPVPVIQVRPAAPALRATSKGPATHRRRPARRQPSAERAPLPAPTAIAEAETHQIQFSTPGGTRIIWVLTADKTAD